MKRIRVEPRPVVYEIACDRCGKEILREGSDFAQMTSIELDAGYDSIFGDGNRVEIDLCELCLRNTLGTWLRVTSPGHASLILARWLAKFEPEKHGGEFPTAADSTTAAHDGSRAGSGIESDTLADESIVGASAETPHGSDDDTPPRPAPVMGPRDGQTPLAAPEGFASWLDFTVDTFDTRGPWLDRLFFADGSPVDRDAIREAARSEPARLRRQGRTPEHLNRSLGLTVSTC